MATLRRSAAAAMSLTGNHATKRPPTTKRRSHGQSVEYRLRPGGSRHSVAKQRDPYSAAHHPALPRSPLGSGALQTSPPPRRTAAPHRAQRPPRTGVGCGGPSRPTGVGTLPLRGREARHRPLAPGRSPLAARQHRRGPVRRRSPSRFEGLVVGRHRSRRRRSRPRQSDRRPCRSCTSSSAQ